jgi:hypothetical protein
MAHLFWQQYLFNRAMAKTAMAAAIHATSSLSKARKFEFFARLSRDD